MRENYMLLNGRGAEPEIYCVIRPICQKTQDVNMCMTCEQVFTMVMSNLHRN